MDGRVNEPSNTLWIFDQTYQFDQNGSVVGETLKKVFMEAQNFAKKNRNIYLFYYFRSLCSDHSSPKHSPLIKFKITFSCY